MGSDEGVKIRVCCCDSNLDYWVGFERIDDGSEGEGVASDPKKSAHHLSPRADPCPVGGWVSWQEQGARAPGGTPDRRPRVGSRGARGTSGSASPAPRGGPGPGGRGGAPRGFEGGGTASVWDGGQCGDVRSSTKQATPPAKTKKNETVQKKNPHTKCTHWLRSRRKK